MPLQRVSAVDWDVEVAQHPGRVLVDFYADWCGPCRALTPLLERIAADHAETVKVVKLDTDADEDLATRFTVRTIPTLIAFEKGEEVGRVVNPQSRAKVEELIR